MFVSVNFTKVDFEKKMKLINKELLQKEYDPGPFILWFSQVILPDKINEQTAKLSINYEDEKLIPFLTQIKLRFS